MSKLMLIDGHSILNRAYYGIKTMTNKDGIHTNAIYGFLNTVFRYMDEEKPEMLAVAFDMHAPTFRHLEYKEYKGKRKEADPEFRSQVPLTQELLKAMNIPVITCEGYEADDILGTIAYSYAAKGYDVVIVSGDKDLLQLASDSIAIKQPKTVKGVSSDYKYYAKDVIAEYGMTPKEFITYKALIGDSSDNIPGVVGIGPVAAKKLIAEYGECENIIANIPNMKASSTVKKLTDSVDEFRFWLKMVTIVTDAPVTLDEEEAKINNLFNADSYELFQKYEFKAFLNRFDNASNFTEISYSDLEEYNNFKVIDDFSRVSLLFKKLSELIAKDEKISLYIDLNHEFSGIAFCFKDDVSDISSVFVPAEGFVTEDYLKSEIVKLLKISDKRNIIVINAKDLFGLFPLNSDYELNEKAIFDLHIANYLVNPDRKEYGLESSCAFFNNRLFPRESYSFIEKKSIDDDRQEYCDCLITIALDIYYSFIEADNKLKEISAEYIFDEIEMPLIWVLHDMEVAGIETDRDVLKNISLELTERIGELEEEIYSLAGEHFNINSTKQLADILFEKLGLPKTKKLKTGFSTSSDELEKIRDNNPIIDKILEYRVNSKLKSTYTDSLADFIAEDGRIHCEYQQTVAATGRLSCTNPNLQNIPIRNEYGKRIRKAFKAKEGCVFLDADYSQIELRILAHMSGDEKLISCFNEGVDIHAMTASEVFDIPLDEVTPLMRRSAKAVNFGIIYGISSFGLGEDLGISKKDAADYIEKYFIKFPAIKTFLDGLVDSARENKYSKTIFNRRRLILDINSSNFMVRKANERIAMNAPIQGSAADIMKIAMIKLYRELKSNNCKSKLILTVHDELIVECVESELEEVRKILESSMSEAAKLKVDLTVELEEGKTLYDVH